MLGDQTNSNDTQNMEKIRQALYQYVLDNEYELDGLGINEISYDFVINQIIKNKNQPQDLKKLSNEEPGNFVPSNNLELFETDMDTLMQNPKDGMYAINRKGIKIVYENKHYYSPDYPDIPAEKNIFGLNQQINIEFVDKIENDLRIVLNSDKTDIEKKICESFC